MRKDHAARSARFSSFDMDDIDAQAEINGAVNHRGHDIMEIPSQEILELSSFLDRDAYTEAPVIQVAETLILEDLHQEESESSFTAGLHKPEQDNNLQETKWFLDSDTDHETQECHGQQQIFCNSPRDRSTEALGSQADASLILDVLYEGKPSCTASFTETKVGNGLQVAALESSVPCPLPMADITEQSVSSMDATEWFLDLYADCDNTKYNVQQQASFCETPIDMDEAIKTKSAQNRSIEVTNNESHDMVIDAPRYIRSRIFHHQVHRPEPAIKQPATLGKPADSRHRTPQCNSHQRTIWRRHPSSVAGENTGSLLAQFHHSNQYFASSDAFR